MMFLQSQPEKQSRKVRQLAAGLSVAVLSVVGLSFLWHNTADEIRTDDAQIDGHIHPVNSRIAGTVIWVDPNVDNTHEVQEGAILARLDPNDYRPEVEALEGEEESTRAQLATAKLDIPIAEASAENKLSSALAALTAAQAELADSKSQKVAAEAMVVRSEASFRRAEDDRVRYLALVSTHEISRSEYDTRDTEAKTTAAQLASASAELEAAEQHVVSSRQRRLQRQYDVSVAKTAPEYIASVRANAIRVTGDLKKSEALLRNAKLNLSYASVVAPVGGIIGRKQIETGQRISVGELLLTLVRPREIWVIANFKETQLKHMRVGQKARIHVDSCDQDVTGIVESFGGATGSKYSLIAPENATGNYVKVVQRVPVRISMDAAQVERWHLLPGMSVEVSVLTHS